MLSPQVTEVIIFRQQRPRVINACCKELDYSCHELEAKKLLKEIGDNILQNRLMQASDLVDEAIVELRMMKAAINSHIKEFS